MSKSENNTKKKSELPIGKSLRRRNLLPGPHSVVCTVSRQIQSFLKNMHIPTRTHYMGLRFQISFCLLVVYCSCSSFYFFIFTLISQEKYQISQVMPSANHLVLYGISLPLSYEIPRSSVPLFRPCTSFLLELFPCHAHVNRAFLLSFPEKSICFLVNASISSISKSVKMTRIRLAIPAGHLFTCKACLPPADTFPHCRLRYVFGVCPVNFLKHAQKLAGEEKPHR